MYLGSMMGLTSRDGITPLHYDKDIGGPVARTAADAVAVFDVIVGYDLVDANTEPPRDHRASRYADYLDRTALRGARIGVVRQWSNRAGAASEVID
jgi:amidase